MSLDCAPIIALPPIVQSMIPNINVPSGTSKKWRATWQQRSPMDCVSHNGMPVRQNALDRKDFIPLE